MKYGKRVYQSLAILAFFSNYAFAAEPQTVMDTTMIDSIKVDQHEIDSLVVIEEKEILRLYEGEEVDSNRISILLAERQPEFPGGEAALVDFVHRNLQYPEQCLKDSIQGRVALSFVIMEDGSISKIEVLRSPDRRLSEEAIRIVKQMPKWEPAMGSEKAVRVRYYLPITFKLEDTYIYTMVDEQPEFPGGEAELMSYLKKMNWSEAIAKDSTILNTSHYNFSFVVEKDGSLSNFGMSHGALSAREYLENHVMSMPKWTPGKKDGKPVRVRFQIPLHVCWRQ